MSDSTKVFDVVDSTTHIIEPKHIKSDQPIPGFGRKDMGLAAQFLIRDFRCNQEAGLEAWAPFSRRAFILDFATDERDEMREGFDWLVGDEYLVELGKDLYTVTREFIRHCYRVRPDLSAE